MAVEIVAPLWDRAGGSFSYLASEKLVHCPYCPNTTDTHGDQVGWEYCWDCKVYCCDRCAGEYARVCRDCAEVG